MMQANKSSLSWLSVGQFALSAIAALLAFAAAALLVLAGVANLLGRAGGVDTVASSLTLALISGLVGVLLLPSVALSLLSLFGKQPPHWVRRLSWQPATALFVVGWPVVLAVGQLAANQANVSWWLLPALQLLAVGLPILWLLSLATRGLSMGSPQRAWGILGAGLTVNPFLAFVSEILVLILGAVAAIVVLASQPGLANQITQLGQRLANNSANPEALSRILAPYLSQPWVIFAALGFTAGLTPLLEELIKPLPLWLLAGRKLTPQEGFSGGILCGAAFALVESSGFLRPGGGRRVGLAGHRARLHRPGAHDDRRADGLGPGAGLARRALRPPVLDLFAGG